MKKPKQKVYCTFTRMVAVEEIIPQPRNPNKHSKKQIELLAKIIKAQGWRAPITVSNRSGFIVRGHARLEAAKLLGLTECPVDFQDYENEAVEWADCIADNRIAELAEPDLPLLKDLLIELDTGALDMELTGYDAESIENLMTQLHQTEEGLTEDDAVPEQVETRCKKGDLWKLGEHRLLCGDSTVITDMERLMGGEKADMVFTDPPYGVNYEGGHFHSGDVNIKRKREKLVGDTVDIYSQFLPIMVMFVDGPCYVWFADRGGKPVFDAITANVCEIHAMLIWNKTNATYAAMNAQYKQRHEPCMYFKPKNSTLRWCGPTDECTVWDMKRDSVNSLHPTQKPVALAERAIGNHQVTTILDMFLGSGSTLIACEKLGRKCYGMEIDEHYCDVIIKRWEDFTGRKGELIDG